MAFSALVIGGEESKTLWVVLGFIRQQTGKDMRNNLVRSSPLPGMVVHTFNLNTCEAEPGRARKQISRYPELYYTE